MGSHSRRTVERRLLALLKPTLRAYALGYVSSTGPRILALTLLQFGRWRKSNFSDDSVAKFLVSISRVLKGAFEVRRFPTFCALLVGLTGLVERPLRWVIASLNVRALCISSPRLARWFSTFIAAWLSISLLQSRRSKSTQEQNFKTTGDNIKAVQHAGRTLDLTLFAFVRAFDVLVNSQWSGRFYLSTALTDPMLFVVSSSLIMWSFVYHPDRLPPAYNRWILSASSVDLRLLSALRLCRKGDICYGQDTGNAHVIQSMCNDYNWPPAWGDPARTIPYPCDIVHMGSGPSCEWHALTRFLKSFGWALKTYFPLNMILLLRKNITRRSLFKALATSLRSSAFLATFITLFYYSTCLLRSRLGPLVLGTSISARQKIDAGYCIAAGSFMCGWSILLEYQRRRTEIVLFVLPRALGTLLPRCYDKNLEWVERVVFAGCTAVVVDAVRERPAKVRGVLGRVLGSVFKA